MAIVLIFLGWFLRYAKSKHLPNHLSNIGDKAKSAPVVVRIVAYLLFITGIFMLTVDFGFWTGLTIFIITLMFTLALTIILLPLNKKYAYVLVILSILALITEYIL